MLALEAAVLVAGHPSAMAVTNDEGTILLPSEGKGTALRARMPLVCVPLYLFLVQAYHHMLTAISSLRACRASRNGGGFQAMGLLRQHHMHQVLAAYLHLSGRGRRVRLHLHGLRAVRLKPIPPRLRRPVLRRPRAQVHLQHRRRRQQRRRPRSGGGRGGEAVGVL